ncbi:hypothetical protein SKAU_G00252490 [Synaphobranchus kaupii]|uniref:Uncharacterized protein n=1 Tax=Synaphobranchus kaupii TaxID=118154 RepID=A0A9Q1IPX9_SYNKA|nr:hypothetical protein SKAU_G00252490 [Synaphobranchus kaupii]
MEAAAGCSSRGQGSSDDEGTDPAWPGLPGLPRAPTASWRADSERQRDREGPERALKGRNSVGGSGSVGSSGDPRLRWQLARIFLGTC